MTLHVLKNRVVHLSLLLFLLVPINVTAAPLERVIVVFKTHFDIGYTALAREVVARYRTSMIDKALAVCDDNRGLPERQQFVWTIPGWPMHQILWEGQTPERRRRVLDAFRSGRFVTHALPFTTHTETLEPEDLVRGLGFASDVCRDAGVPLPRDAKMTDVPCHSWILPTLLVNAGVEFLHIGCNSACSAPSIPTLFWWEGPDGSRLLTWYSADGYGTGLLPPEGWPLRTYLALMHTGDNHGPPRPDEVARVRAEAARDLPGVELTIGRLSDFSDAVRAEQPDLPVIRGDMPDTWIHGPMSDPQGWSTARRIRPALQTLELLSSHMRLSGGTAKKVTETVGDAYEHSLLYGEHTWGGSLAWIGRHLPYGDAWHEGKAAGKFARSEESWREHTSYIERAAAGVTPALDEQLDLLARSVSAEGLRVVVYNPLPWPRDGVVRVGSKVGLPEALRPAAGGVVSPVMQRGDAYEFIARNVPAGGHSTYVPASIPSDRSDCSADGDLGIIENEFLRIRLDEGPRVVTSLVEKSTGRELVDRSARYGMGQYLYERFDRSMTTAYNDAYLKNRYDWALRELAKPGLPSASEVPYRAVVPVRLTRTFYQDQASVSAVFRAAEECGLPHDLVIRIVLYSRMPFVEITFDIGSKPCDPWPEAGWMCLPFSAAEPEYRLGRLGGPVNYPSEILPGSNHHVLCLHTGMAIQGTTGSIGLCPLDAPLVSIGVPGMWRYTRDYRPGQPHVFVNLFNNQWSTNFRFWCGGTWSSTVRVWSVNATADEAALVTPSWNARLPLRAGVVSSASKGPLPLRAPGVSLSRKGTLVTAWGPGPVDGELLLRIWEQAGLHGPCEVDLPSGLTHCTVTPCDLRGRPQGSAITVENGSFQVDLPAWAPKSFLIARMRT